MGKGKKRNSRKHDGLASKVLKLELFHDLGGQFFAYCTSPYHRGIVLRPYVCQRRNCPQYHKFYVGHNNTEPSFIDQEKATDKHYTSYCSGRNGSG